MEDRIAKRVNQEGDCLIWEGARNNKGYGILGVNGKTTLVHRHVWVQSGRELPEGLTIDHLCRVKRCVNVDHMEVVTRSENSRRAAEARRPVVVQGVVSPETAARTDAVLEAFLAKVTAAAAARPADAPCVACRILAAGGKRTYHYHGA
ncbi:HNH endonuclease signature motif containing protein [Rathayibacter sp. VKM Ac-2630]|uniref:HNH endonuclease signature motif containing protein n=1 Tax=Rathayibacter sp. VKM Ac-2630 TaxID=1938617 RepID=UPI0009C7C2ED|nr:HNH endonuclease signature motif containing protein [Rathayibacter sp. VKM Ac-2630]OOB91217.1 hypothetical protein B0T42_07415 [Rathayibacter sp. VKM Ac-2630]